MKKLLLLGGSHQQIVAINKAKECGYYTIVCDYLTDNPGQYIADKFYLASTTDKELILSIAEKEKIDGIVAYASDPAAPTAAYVAEKLNLPGNSYESVKILSEKHLFRKYLSENGFSTPASISSFEYSDKLLDKISAFTFPLIVKPTDSSGSKGITKIETLSELKKAFDVAKQSSRNSIVQIEEFIEKSHSNLIGGDVFVNNKKVTFWGLLNCHRDANVNPLVPVGKSYPLQLTKEMIFSVRCEIEKLVSSLDIKFGAFNVEVIIGKNNKVYFIEFGPRNGGNMIPDLLSLISGKDLIRATIECAMGCFAYDTYFDMNDCYFATHNLHSDKNGILHCITFDKEISKYIIKKSIYKHKGDQIEYFNAANKAIGIIFMKFPDIKTELRILSDIQNHIIIELQEVKND